MQIDNHFDVPLTPAAAWPLLMDVPRTAACFPGASMIETVTADHYKGQVTVKLGPLTMLFAGALHIEGRDDGAHCATVHAQWRETRGRGNAVTVTRFSLHPRDGGTRVALHSDLQLAGQVAQYGRGTGMIAAISTQLIASFAKHLHAMIQAPESAPATPTAAPIAGLSLVAKALRSRLP
jgi:uncharacterized protein